MEVRSLVAALSSLVTAGRPAGWCPGDRSPHLLDEDEAIRYLRLDEIGIKNPKESLRRYRELGLPRGTQVGKRVYDLRDELDRFLLRSTEINPR